MVAMGAKLSILQVKERSPCSAGQFTKNDSIAVRRKFSAWKQKEHWMWCSCSRGRR